jgi:hypothetical protein
LPLSLKDVQPYKTNQTNIFFIAPESPCTKLHLFMSAGGPLLVDASIRASMASSDDWDGFADVSPSLYGIVDGKNMEN